MDGHRENRTRVQVLIEGGVTVHDPDTVWIAPEVQPDRILPGSILHPGCRLRGKDTWIGPAAEVGEEAPATVEDCRIGPGVKLKGGFFKRSTFLEGASMGSGAQVREGCLLEELASGAHTVGLKQTILFPFVTLGSLVNFCDCLMAGGTTRRDHSEVGSSYIHFNYTPHQDKATASLFGDVARGVMLDQRPVFLGGQGGTVGPVRLGFGTVAVAGAIVRKDCVEGHRLLKAEGISLPTEFIPGLYRDVRRVVTNNLHYIANLHALGRWYAEVRSRFFSGASAALHAGAVEVLDLALAERIKRLGGLADNMSRSLDLAAASQLLPRHLERQKELLERWNDLKSRLEAPPSGATGAADRDLFLQGLEAGIAARGGDYLEVVSGLEPDVRKAGADWLLAGVNEVVASAQSVLPAFTR